MNVLAKNDNKGRECPTHTDKDERLMSVESVSKADIHFQRVSSRGMTLAKPVGIPPQRLPPTGRKAVVSSETKVDL